MKAKKLQFRRLSAAQKRVAIAKDVVAQIKAHQYRIQQGTWLEVDEIDEVAVRGACQSVLTGKVAEFTPPKCSCCALGAAMASSLRLFNIGEFDNSIEFPQMQEQMGRFFSKEQLALIEGTFEQRGGVSSDFDAHVSDNVIEKAQAFSGIGDDEDRALAIFKNIIKNNGTFVP